MRWLLLKDLRILARSRLLVVLLVVYPLAVALLIGFALSRSPARPRVAIVNETAPGETISVGGRHVPVGRYVREVLAQVEAVPVATRAQAVARVRSGSAAAAIVIPSDLAARLSSDVSRAQLEVIYNGNALEQSLVQSTIESELDQADLAFSRQVQQAAAAVLDGLLKGGTLGAKVGAPADLIGLSEIPALLKRLGVRLPPGAARMQLERVREFASFAAANLAVSKQVLSTIGQPIVLHDVVLHGRRTPLSRFAVVVAVSISLMFLGVLLGAGGVALEREEGALGRLLRGLVPRTGLLAEKGLLAAVCAFMLAFALLAGISAFVALDWSRAGAWIAALACGALACGALGVAIGVLAREVRAASLMAFLASLPLAFLALVPSSSVSHGLLDVIDVVSFLFPFKAALQALDAAVNGSSPSLPGPIAHLLVLACALLALARAGLSRVESD